MLKSLDQPSVLETTHYVGSKTYAYRTMASKITEMDGTVIHTASAIEVPKDWSQTACDILSQKYFRKAGVPDKVKVVPEKGIFPDFRRSVPTVDAIFGSETSAHKVFIRLAGCWTYWGIKKKYFTTKEEASSFFNNCYDALYNQYASPNSPQWFNTGLYWAYGITSDISSYSLYHLENNKPVHSTVGYEHSAVHACFIQSVEDHLLGNGGIMDLFVREAGVFKYGSGSGSNYSKVRGLGESLAGGGTSSGLMSWLKIGDTSAGAIKSGGTTRRAARMVTLDMDHPEIEKYIGWKVEEENKVAALITGSRLNKTLANNIVHAEDSDVFDHAVAAAYEAGVPTGLIQRAVQANSYGYELDLAEFDSHWEGEGYQSVSGQNANNSISVPDEFMEALENRGPWNLTARTTGETIKTVEAEYLWKKAMTAAWVSADPGVHYSGTMNKWNTCLNDERIVATNPCSEYIFLDDTACFTGDTLVWTMDGPVRFDVLAKSGKTVPVLTELHDGTLAYRDMVRPRKTKRDAELVEVTFKARGAKGRKNSYTTVRCTPDHIFFLRDGTSKKAKNLLPDDRIESAYRYTSDKYVTINGSSEGMIREHILTAEYKYGERPDPTLHHVHHRDEDGHNNAQNNIIVKTIEKHIGDHSKAWFKNATTEQKILRSKRISKAHTGKVLSKEHRAKLSASHKGIRQSEEVVAKRAAANTGKKRSPEQIIRLKQGLAKRRSEGTYTTVAGRIWITNDVDNQRIEADSKIPRGWRRGRASWKEKVESGPTNHSVVSVKRLRTKQDVYCGTVGDTGRFFISLGNNHAEGVLVKNCNLASLNLVTIMNKSKWNFQVFAGELRFFSRLFQTVLDISIEMAQFVSEPIARKTAEYRTTGLGYANLGSLIMRMGHAYGDKASKSLTGYITAIMTGEAYLTSADIADGLGAFPAFKRNESSFMNVMRMHSDCVNHIPDDYQGAFLYDARDVWNQVTERTQFRNAFTTCIAPTGTIGLVMDCDTTGIEPDFSLIKSKKLAGGGYMRLLNSAVPQALKQLGYDEAEIKEVEAYIFGHNSFSAVSDIEMITEIDLLAYVSKPDLNAIYRDIPKMYTLHQVIEAIGKIANADLSFMLKDPGDSQ
jgi:ribonucleotide reductase alpha subunit